MIKRATVIVTCKECGDKFDSEVPYSLQRIGTTCPKHIKKTTSQVVLKQVIETVYAAEVSSNGRTVWIDKGDECLARFNEITREYQNAKPFEERYTIYSNLDIPPEEMYFAWEAFVIEVKKRFGVSVGAEHMPNFISKH